MHSQSCPLAKLSRFYEDAISRRTKITVLAYSVSFLASYSTNVNIMDKKQGCFSKLPKKEVGNLPSMHFPILFLLHITSGSLGIIYACHALEWTNSFFSSRQE